MTHDLGKVNSDVHYQDGIARSMCQCTHTYMYNLFPQHTTIHCLLNLTVQLLITKSRLRTRQYKIKDRYYTAIFEPSPRRHNDKQWHEQSIRYKNESMHALWFLLVPLHSTSCYNDQASRNICVQDSKVKLIPTYQSLANVTAVRHVRSVPCGRIH